MGYFIFLNLASAILFNTFYKLDEVRIALYNYEVLVSMQEYAYEPTYFGLISACPPLNVVSFACSPFYIYLKNKKMLNKINKFIMYFSYLPFPILLAPFYLLWNVILLPFAYVVLIVVYAKKYKANKNSANMKELLFYIFLSPLVLIVSLFTDLYVFWKHLYQKNYEKISGAEIPDI